MQQGVRRVHRDSDHGSPEDRNTRSDGAEQTRLTLDAAGIGTWSWDIASGNVRWSAVQERIYGHAAGSFPGTYDAFTAAIHPDDRERVLASIADSLDRRTDRRIEYRVVQPDGVVRWIDQFSRVLTGADGVARGMMGVTIDVTDRHGAEEDDRHARELLQAVFRGVVDGITIQDPTGALLFANDAAAEIIGFPSAQRLIDASTPEIQQRFAMFDDAGRPLPLGRLPGRRALRGEHPPEMVVRYHRTGSDEDRWSLIRATPVLDDAGVVLYAVNIFRDITDQKRAEDDLRHSEARYRLLFESNPYPMWVFDVATLRFLAVNDAALHHYGYRRDEFLALSLVDIRPPEDVDAIRTKAAHVAADPDGIDHAGVWRHRRRDGSFFLAEVITHAVLFDGRPARLSLAIDVTAREQGTAERAELVAQLAAERARLAAVLEQLPVGVIIAEAPSARILSTNAWIDALGQPSIDAVTGADETGVLAASGDASPLARAIGAGKVVHGEDLVIPHAGHDGAPVTIRVNAAPIRDEHGRIVAGVATIDDVTERRRLELGERFLAEASTLLAESLDEEATLVALAQLTVPRLGDLSMIDLVDPSGALQRVAVTHHDPTIEPLVRELDALAAPGADPPVGSLRVARTGTTELLGPPPSGDAVPAAESSHLTMMRRLGLHSSCSVPLVARGRMLGVLTLARGVQGRPIDPADLSLVEELGRRAAVALDNARLYEAEQIARAAAEHASSRIARLQDVTADLAGALTAERVAEVVIERGVAALDAQAGLIVLLVDDGAAFSIVRAVGYPPEMVEPWRRIPAETRVPFADAVRMAEPVLLRSAKELSARYPQLATAPDLTGYQAIAAIPLLVDGRAIGALGLSFADPRPFDDDIGFMLALSLQCAQALERARLYEAERATRDRAEIAGVRLAFLAEASTVLSESLNYEETLASVATLAVPRVADWCSVHVVTEDGAIQQLVVTHAEPAKAAWAKELSERYPTDPAAPSGVPRVVRTGVSELYPEISDELLVASARDEGHLEVLRALGMHSVMIVPLCLRERTLGAISFVAAERDRGFDADDLSLAEDLARRCAIAIEHARLFGEAQAAIRARDEFLSIASHELRTPVTSIKGYAQMLLRAVDRDGGMTERQRTFLRTIDDATDRLTLLTSDLLDVSRIRLGQLPLRPRPVDLVTCVQTAVDQLRHRMADGKEEGAKAHEPHPISIDIRGEIGLVSADPDRIDQVLTNLLENAAKYSPNDGPIVVTVAPEEGGVLVSVADRGIGLPPGETEEIFEPFNRATNAVRGQLPGLGLGLYICRSIAERHGGRIWAESAGAGTGTVMHLWLPIGAETREQPVEGQVAE